MPAPPTSNSLVGLPPPARGDAVALMGVMGAGRDAGPIEALAFALAPPGPGEGLGLVEGGRRELIVVYDSFFPVSRMC